MNVPQIECENLNNQIDYVQQERAQFEDAEEEKKEEEQPMAER